MITDGMRKILVSRASAGSKIEVQLTKDRSSTQAERVFVAKIGLPGGLKMQEVAADLKEAYRGTRAFLGTSRTIDTMLVSSGGTHTAAID